MSGEVEISPSARVAAALYRSYASAYVPTGIFSFLPSSLRPISKDAADSIEGEVFTEGVPSESQTIWRLMLRSAKDLPPLLTETSGVPVPAQEQSAGNIRVERLPPRSSFDPDSFVTSVQCNFFVTTTLAQREETFNKLKQNINPTKWARQPESIFTRSDMVETDAYGNAIFDHGAPRVKGKGEDQHPNGMMFERYEFNPNYGSVFWVENLLQIGWTEKPWSAQATYSLSDCIRSRVGLDEMAGGFDVNEGLLHCEWIEADDLRSSGFNVRMTKDFRANDRTPRFSGGNLIDLGQILNLILASIGVMVFDRGILIALQRTFDHEAEAGGANELRE